MPKITREELVELIRGATDTAVGAAMEARVQPLIDRNADISDILRGMTPPAPVVSDPRKMGIGAARFVRAMAAGRGDPTHAAAFAKKAWSDTLGDSVHKVLQAQDFTGAGALIPEEYAAEIVELLRARTAVRAAGARVLPLNQGTLTIRKQTGAATATYTGESAAITTSQPTAGQIVLVAKKLAALVPISNDLLIYSAGNTADEFVRDDLVNVLAIREDQAFIRDDGTQETPKGLRYWAASANVLASAGDTAANVEADLKAMVNKLETSNVRMVNPVWFMAPRTKNHLLTLREAAGGNLVFPSISFAGGGTLYGWPVYTTTTIPTNLGAGSDSEIYLVDMADAIIGEAQGIEIAVDSSASYTDGSGLVSAFQRDETLMRAIARHDFALRHPESCTVTSDIGWGA